MAPSLARVDRFVRGKYPHKYTAIMDDGTRVHFGHQDYEQYRDSVPPSMGGGKWSNRDHGDAGRRRNYRARHSGVKTKGGTPAYKKKYSPSWFSYHFLW